MKWILRFVELIIFIEICAATRGAFIPLLAMLFFFGLNHFIVGGSLLDILFFLLEKFAITAFFSIVALVIIGIWAFTHLIF